MSPTVSGHEVSADGRKLARESRYVRAYDSGRRRLACRVWNKRPFPVQRPSRATSASSLSVPVDITPSGDYRGRFTISDSGGHSRTYEVSIASGVRDMTVTEIAQ